MPQAGGDVAAAPRRRGQWKSRPVWMLGPAGAGKTVALEWLLACSPAAPLGDHEQLPFEPVWRPWECGEQSGDLLGSFAGSPLKWDDRLRNDKRCALRFFFSICPPPGISCSTAANRATSAAGASNAPIATLYSRTA